MIAADEKLAMPLVFSLSWKKNQSRFFFIFLPEKK